MGVTEPLLTQKTAFPEHSMLGYTVALPSLEKALNTFTVFFQAS
jgi:hypothetical protein